MHGPERSCPRARRLAGPLSFGLAILLLAGCASTPQSRALTASPPAGLPARAELEQVPFFPQSRYQCGPAALATLLNEAGRDVTPDELVAEVYVPEREGSLRTEIRAATRARGLVPHPLPPQLASLSREIAAGRPVLVMQNLAFDWYPKWHYAVAVGYDLPEQGIVLRSGTTRRHEMSLRTFERTWARADHWAQVVVAPDRPPATAEPLPWLSAVHELEQTGDPASALAGYRAATERWPESVEAWMVRGNSAYAAGDLAEARAAFREAVTLEPERAEGWNNYAYALAGSGCPAAARGAARCAVRLAPEDAGIADTLQEMESLPESGDGGHCPVPACPVGD